MDQSRYFRKHLKKSPARLAFNLKKVIDISKEGMCQSGGGLVTSVILGKGLLEDFSGLLLYLLNLSARLLCPSP